jgi:hypothetical protein
MDVGLFDSLGEAFFLLNAAMMGVLGSAAWIWCLADRGSILGPPKPRLGAGPGTLKCKLGEQA